MVAVRKAILTLALVAEMMFGTVTSAHGQVITSPTGNFKVGIATLGNLFDPPTGIGFLRVSDGFDPIRPGTPYEAWGVSAGAVGGFVAPQVFGTSNIVANGSPIFGANSAFISAFLNAPNSVTKLLQIDQAYSFVNNDNVLKITTTITNASASAQAVLFRRLVDWDLGPPPGNPSSEVTTAPPYSIPITSASHGAIDIPDPTIPFLFPIPPAGGTFGPLNGIPDNGAGLQLSLGTLNPGATVSFDIFEAITQVGESQAALINQVLAGGAGYVIGSTGFPGSVDSAALGIRTPGTLPPTVSEPASLALLGVGLFGLLGYGCHRRWRCA
jgi:hypothetical protein